MSGLDDFIYLRTRWNMQFYDTILKNYKENIIYMVHINETLFINLNINDKIRI